MYALEVKDKVTSINGVLCYGTYKMMAEKIYGVITKYGYKGSFEETQRLTLETHKKHSDKGVVTTDVLSVTKRCLKLLEIEEYFDEIYTDDGSFLPKPAPDAALDLCRKYNLDISEILMVGDTKTDIDFAKNAGIKVICVAKTEENRQILLNETQNVVKDISYITLQ